jgi:aspartate carbamoyltransferase catalytic subunit
VPIVRRERPALDVLRGRIIANVFLEDSTRTRGSFTVAAHRLGATTLDVSSKGSSVSKGESTLDTIWTIESFGVDCIVVRAPGSGAAEMIAHQVNIPVVNAGDGKHEHPTQGLLDALTLRQRFGELRGKRIAIVGDVVASRVARSNIHCLTALGAQVLLIGPPTLVPAAMAEIVNYHGGASGAAQRSGLGAQNSGSGCGEVSVAHNLDQHLDSLDAVMMLRVQFERGTGITDDFRDLYALTEARVKRLPPHAVVMHPGPMNRGLEIDAVVADDPTRSVIRQQVANGVAVRMAVLRGLLE